MSIYIILYIISFVTSIFWWVLIYKIYKNFFWLFFLLATIFISIWFSWYFLFFCGIENVNILLLISKLCFFSWICSTYSLLFSIYFFNKNKVYYSKDIIYKVVFFYISVAILYIPTDFIIEWLNFSKKEHVYREIYWKLYFIHILLQASFIFLFIYFSIKRVKEQIYINKIRLKYILLATFISIFSAIILQLILPLFWIRILEKEIILVFVWFVLSVLIITKRYHFWKIWYWLWKWLISVNAILLSIVFTNTLSLLYFKVNNWYWEIQNTNLLWTNILTIVFYIIFYNILSKIFLWFTKKDELKLSIEKLEQSISYIDNINSLNNFLKKEIKKIFKTDNFEIKLYSKIWEKKELKKYFENELNEKIFINDIVFIEEKKNRFKKEFICKEISKNDFLIFPIYDKKENIWILAFWTKAFWDFYDIDEINSIKNLLFFIEYHLKYIKNYEQIKDLSLNLDKKVDEKTIEYNNLINKQKEFISMISHEIRSPISSAIFQADSIIDDVNSWEINIEKLKTELEILNSLLIKTWDLSAKLFSVQYYDTHSISLYKEKIQISNLLKNEIEIYSHINESIEFIDNVDEKIWFIEIDKIQFQQVIENILTNSIKFINNENWIISIEAFVKNNFLVINIEDNWKWFDWISTTNLFEKYTTWGWNSTWLWMWLYLCKRIVEMHKWEIRAFSSKKLWWAKFLIKIPIN